MYVFTLLFQFFVVHDFQTFLFKKFFGELCIPDMAQVLDKFVRYKIYTTLVFLLFNNQNVSEYYSRSVLLSY